MRIAAARVVAADATAVLTLLEPPAAGVEAVLLLSPTCLICLRRKAAWTVDAAAFCTNFGGVFRRSPMVEERWSEPLLPAPLHGREAPLRTRLKEMVEALWSFGASTTLACSPSFAAAASCSTQLAGHFA